MTKLSQGGGNRNVYTLSSSWHVSVFSCISNENIVLLSEFFLCHFFVV